MKKIFPYCLALSLTLLAAHVARLHGVSQGLYLLGLACLIFTRQAYAGIVCGLTLSLGVFVWIDAGIKFLRFRLAFELPWLRLALILALALGFMLYCLWMLLSGTGRDYFRRSSKHCQAQAASFILCSLILFIARSKASLLLLLADRFWPGAGTPEILLLSLYAAWLCGKLLGSSQTAALRTRYWSLFSMIFFLQLLLGLAGFSDFLMTGRLHLPVPALIAAGPLYRGEGYFMPILFGAAVLLLGPGWCSHLCYIGAWDGLASQARGKPPHRVSSRLGYLRLLNLALCTGLALLFRHLGVPGWQAALAAGLFGLAGVCVMLKFSRPQGVMLHCLAYCPIGILGNVLGRISPWRIRIGASCSGCGRCSKSCRYGALSPRDILGKRPGLSCTLCGDCLGGCEQGALGYRFFKLSPAQARAAFFALVAALHAVFLGVARI